MALAKPIKQPDGVTTNYHRILFIQSTINSHVSIVVLSYIDEESRRAVTENGLTYKASITYEKDYEENMTVKKAYMYLKTLPAFEGAEDILDDNDTNEITGEEFLEMVEEVL